MSCTFVQRKITCLVMALIRRSSASSRSIPCFPVTHTTVRPTNIRFLHMCGRREWSYDDTKAEFEMLWKRTNQGQTGKFTADTLFGHEIAGMEPKPISTDSYSRPNLDPLHNELLQLTGDGWRPLIPLRTAIMTLIAGILE